MSFDITQLSTSYNQMKLLQAVNVGMLSKTLDSMKTQGAGMEKLLSSGSVDAGVSAAAMELSVNPSVGSNFDFSV